MSNPNINRAQLAKFLPSPQAIKAFEGLFKAVADGLPSSLEDVEATAGAAQQQAGEALATLALVADQLARLLLAPSQESVASDSYGPPTDFSSHLDLYVPPAEPNNFYNPVKVKITGGTIDGVVIGGTTAAAGTFTDIRGTRLGLGAAPSVNNVVTVGGTAPQTGAVGRSYGNSVTIPANVTSWYIGSHSELGTAAAAFTLSEISHFKVQPPAKGAGSTITGEYGFYAVGLTRATNNYGFYSDMAVAANTWNFYANGSARNFFNGITQIGNATPTAGDEKLQVNGSLSINSATMLRTYTAFTNGAGVASGTLTNAPVAGNPTKWIPINDNGTTRYIPAW
jgi:hypothetical protein